MSRSALGHGSPPAANGKARARRAWNLAQMVSPFLFVMFLVWSVWGGYRPDLSSGQDVFQHLIVCATLSMFYLALQGFTVVLQPVGSDVRPLIDVLTSLVPLLVIAFALERMLSGYSKLDFYQLGVLWITGLVALIDLSCFTLFVMKVNRLAPDVVVTS